MNNLTVEKNVQTKFTSKALNTGSEDDICILVHTNSAGIRIYSIGADYANSSFPQVWLTNMHSFHAAMKALEFARHGADIFMDGPLGDREMFEKASHKERFLLAYACGRGYLTGGKV